MSYTSVYAVYKTKASCLCELRNGHGSGPAIWDYIALKLTGKRLPIGNVDWFWKLWKDERLSENEKAVLISTYDWAVVEIEHLERFSIACEEIHNKIIDETDWTWNHFKDIGEQAKALNKKHDYRCIGLGIGCTSVCDPWEGHNFKKDESWGIYSYIDGLKSKSDS
jgi:hypothetical protein